VTRDEAMDPMLLVQNFVERLPSGNTMDRLNHLMAARTDGRTERAPAAPTRGTRGWTPRGTRGWTPR